MARVTPAPGTSRSVGIAAWRIFAFLSPIAAIARAVAFSPRAAIRPFSAAMRHIVGSPAR